MIESLIKHLEHYSKLEDSVDVERFDATLSQIAELNDPRAIGLLLPFFKDDCKFPEVMFSIIHTIEMFEDKKYVQEILRGLPMFSRRSPAWAKKVHFAIFNYPPTREAYREQLARAGATTKIAAKDFLTKIGEQEPKFAQVCNEMLAVLFKTATNGEA